MGWCPICGADKANGEACDKDCDFIAFLLRDVELNTIKSEIERLTNDLERVKRSVWRARLWNKLQDVVKRADERETFLRMQWDMSKVPEQRLGDK